MQRVTQNSGDVCTALVRNHWADFMVLISSDRAPSSDVLLVNATWFVCVVHNIAGHILDKADAAKNQHLRLDHLQAETKIAFKMMLEVVSSSGILKDRLLDDR